jgi:mannose-6-phosphate isomerase-like protein (cupin superfamily)
LPKCYVYQTEEHDVGEIWIIMTGTSSFLRNSSKIEIALNALVYIGGGQVEVKAKLPLDLIK